MPEKIECWAAWLTTVDIDSIASTREASRRYFVNAARGWLLHDENEELSDQQIWKREYRDGWRIVPITITRR